MGSSIGSRIRSAREERGLLARDMARLLGVSQAAYSHWESGKSEPRASDMARMCMILRVSADDLLGIADNPARNKGKYAKEWLSIDSSALTEDQCKSFCEMSEKADAWDSLMKAILG